MRKDLPSSNAPRKSIVVVSRIIEDQNKVPVFVEFDEDAIDIWKRFVSLMLTDSKKPSRSKLIQIRYEMEQYMIGVSEKDVEAVGLEQHSGIYRISHQDVGLIYNEITGFNARSLK
jgi:hypothetical protein